MAYQEVLCCVMEEGVRCGSIAGCATFDKRWLKNVSQRRQRYLADPEVNRLAMAWLIQGSKVWMQKFVAQ